MPHISVKLWPGRSDELKKKLADELAQTAAGVLGEDMKFVSVAVEEIQPEKWADTVYEPEIRRNPNLVRVPDYEP